MGQQSGNPSSIRHLKSPFSKVIATRYYDGPMEGFVAHNDWPHACLFQLVDWDRETDIRVYEVTRVEDFSFDEVVEALFRDRRPTWPVWVLPSGARERGQRLLAELTERTRPVATLTTRDLFGDILVWDAADDAPLSSGLILAAQSSGED
ncbi:MAG: hypothetical protein K0R38_5263 [Polyangiaceae bacterium]|jgi:hypothetical protein|nr:hypothetical protein [Polyangiaceae bacterium]